MHFKSSLTSLTLFCKVVDNYGDIGICWRLAKQFANEFQLIVTLWVDDLSSFQRLCPNVVIDYDIQQIDQVTVRHWRDQNGAFHTDDVSDIVIEFFGCDLPPAYIAAMATCTPHPVWLNLEGLSAESWVEGCHTLPSPHPSLSLTKYFFFPGFTHQTGGVLLESALLQQRQAFQQNPAAIRSFLAQLGLTSDEIAATKISLFCYPHAPVMELFAAWKSNQTPITCLVPEGVATEALQSFFANAANVGSIATQGALTVRVIPFLAQPDYDKLLWACDLNMVRGEDSFVRAQWAARPFIWHIYPQDKNLHHIKLNAFLQRYSAKTSNLVEFTLVWNAAANPPVDFAVSWPLLQTDMPEIAIMSMDWQQQLLANGNLAENILGFSKNKLAENQSGQNS